MGLRYKKSIEIDRGDRKVQKQKLIDADVKFSEQQKKCSINNLHDGALFC